MAYAKVYRNADSTLMKAPRKMRRAQKRRMRKFQGGNPSRQNEPHYVYAFQVGERVKIGLSVAPMRRAQEIAAMSGEAPTVLGLIRLPDLRSAREQERRFHKGMRHLNIQYEWFKPEAMRLFIPKKSLGGTLEYIAPISKAKAKPTPVPASKPPVMTWKCEQHEFVVGAQRVEGLLERVNWHLERHHPAIRPAQP